MNTKRRLQRDIGRIFFLAIFVFTASLAFAEVITDDYDNAGQVKKVTYGSGTIVEYTYDNSGNRTSMTITSDVVPPDTVLVSANPSAGMTNITDISFVFSSTETGSTFECRLDGGAWTDCNSGTITYTGLASIPDRHTFDVRATDPAGNVDQTPASYVWTIDTISPNAPMVSGTTPTSNSTPTWIWMRGGNGGNGTYRYKLDNSDLTTGATETTASSFTPGTPLSLGSRILYVQERDDAGNWSESGSFTILIDHTFTISFSFMGSGAMTCNPTTVPLGGSFACTLYAGSGYYLESLLDNTMDVKSLVSNNLYSVGNVTADHTIDAAFQQNPPVLRILGNNNETWYTQIQSAYNAASSTDDILTLASDFYEDLDFNRNVSITLRGGCNPDFNSMTAWTVLNGKLTISDGTVTIENLMIK